MLVVCVCVGGGGGGGLSLLTEFSLFVCFSFFPFLSVCAFCQDSLLPCQLPTCKLRHLIACRHFPEAVFLQPNLVLACSPGSTGVVVVMRTVFV